MGKAYGIDLREKVIGYIDRGRKTQEAAEVFGIGRRTVERWINLKGLGELNPKKQAPNGPWKIDISKLEEFINSHNDYTLMEISEHFPLKIVLFCIG